MEWFDKNEVRLRVLQHHEEIKQFSRRLAHLGLNSHHDHQKNWDTLLAFMAISTLDNRPLKILDAGSGQKSVILQWVRQKYKNSELYACDRVDQNNKIFTELNVSFSVQEMSNSNYIDDYFDFVASISVIEHGVDVFAFITEMKRVLKSGGILAISTDYWDEKREFPGKFPYGKEFGTMKLFSKKEILEICDYAIANGFEIINNQLNFDLDCYEKAVRWERMDEEYTFCFIPLRKKRT